MARKKSIVEISQPARGAKPARIETVSGKHTITYEAPVSVPVVETEDDPDIAIEEAEFEGIEETNEEPEHREPPFHVRLRQRFRRRGITGNETLTLRVDRLPNFERDGLAGVRVDKEFCGIITCTEKFFDSENHLIEIQRRYGPGAYWLTLRYKNAIVDAWREHISGFPASASSAPIAPEAGQVSHQVVYQPTPNQPQQPVAVQDPLAQMRQAFKLVRDLRDDLGLVMPQPPAPAPAAPTDPKIAALQLIAENPDVMDSIGSGIAKTVLGSRGEKDSNPWADVAMEAIKTGQAPQIVATLIREFMAPFRNLWGNNNGQAAVDQAPLQNQTRPGDQQQGQIAPGQEVGQVATPGNASGGVAGDVHQDNNEPQDAAEISPVDELIYDLITLMERQASIAETRPIVNRAILHAPWLRESIDDLIDRPTEQLLELMTAYNPAVAQMAHAREWLESLIEALIVNQEGDGE